MAGGTVTIIYSHSLCLMFQGVCHADQNTEELSLCYANRSAALFYHGLYKVRVCLMHHKTWFFFYHSNKNMPPCLMHSWHIYMSLSDYLLFSRNVLRTSGALWRLVTQAICRTSWELDRPHAWASLKNLKYPTSQPQIIKHHHARKAETLGVVFHLVCLFTLAPRKVVTY